MTGKNGKGRITSHPILEFKRGRKITIYFNRKPITAYEGDTIAAALEAVSAIALPDGYYIYEAGNLEALKQGRDLTWLLLGLAVFLVLVVMAVE